MIPSPDAQTSFPKPLMCFRCTLGQGNTGDKHRHRLCMYKFHRMHTCWSLSVLLSDIQTENALIANERDHL
uniref:Ovule protein n=1 Tax=Panagrellus redivivus TaxID=6233 RepID=A0A7E4ULK5_PANRE